MAKRRTLGDLLETVINERRFTVFCDEADVRPHTVSELLAGNVARPQRATIAKLAKALGVDAATVRAAIEAQRAGK